jgi:hypothetical protein
MSEELREGKTTDGGREGKIADGGREGKVTCQNGVNSVGYGEISNIPAVWL